MSSFNALILAWFATYDAGGDLLQAGMGQEEGRGD
jgi:hypothetical protein